MLLCYLAKHHFWHRAMHTRCHTMVYYTGGVIPSNANFCANLCFAIHRTRYMDELPSTLGVKLLECASCSPQHQ